MDLIDGFHRMRWVRILQLPGFTDDQATAFPSDGPPRNVIQRMGVSTFWARSTRDGHSKFRSVTWWLIGCAPDI